MDATTRSPLAVNDLAAAYQPRRVWAAALSIAWNMLGAALVLLSGAAAALNLRLTPLPVSPTRFWWAVPTYVAAYFALYCLWNFPLELWFGYWEERQFGLASQGVRAWAKDWFIGVAQHGVMFVIGSSLIVMLQALMPASWTIASAALLLALFLLSSYLAADLVPHGLYQFERADAVTAARLQTLLGPGVGDPRLPRVVIYSGPNQRDFSGGLIGLGNRQVLLMSRSTLELASNDLLRFVLLHELGHRRYHHFLLAALAGWAWVAAGLALCARIIPHELAGTPIYVAYLGLTLSLWLAAGEPLLAYLGRRLEYQADRHYIRHGNVAQMRIAMEELSRRNLARTEGLSLRHTVFHPLPSIFDRLRAGAAYEQSLPAKERT